MLPSGRSREGLPARKMRALQALETAPGGRIVNPPGTPRPTSQIRLRRASADSLHLLVRRSMFPCLA